MSNTTLPENFIMVIYGATGDLTKRKLIPALFSLFKLGLLPSKFRILGFARRPYDNAQFIETFLPYIDKNDLWQFDSFSKSILYVNGDFDKPSSYSNLKSVIHEVESEIGECQSKLYYMAVSPLVLPTVIENIGEHGLHIGCGERGKWTRIIVEKPFGHNLASVKALNETILRYFSEEQIYRIDHYLGKETVQNILTTRFINSIFKPIWNCEYIDHIQITAIETLGVENRGGYYDNSGALRDLVQSHLLQILSLVAMNEPERFDATSIRNEKNNVLKSLRLIEDVGSDVVRGQYVSSHDATQRGYLQESQISPDSTTETFVALKAFVDLSGWKDVPFYIRTGKKLNKKTTEIHIVFKKTEAKVFSNLFCELRSNVLSIYLQPNEGMKLKVLIKEPGFGLKISDVGLSYSYQDNFGRLPGAYERLLLDTLIGDQSLFTRTDEIESSWIFIDNILKAWEDSKTIVSGYEVNSTGPSEANLLIERDKRAWIN